jgi:hypothetical protein
MKRAQLPCTHKEIEHLRKFISYAKKQINGREIYPPINQYRCLVALALYSKNLTVAEAILVLLEAGFGDEAFGMTRTMIDVYFTLFYIANKDTEERAKLYYEFYAKDTEDLKSILQRYWPQLLQGVPFPNRATVAKNYPHPHRWSGRPVSDMALEPHTAENDPATGKPVVHDLGYRIYYRWTSHYVHPTIGAIRNHLVRPGGDVFVVQSGRGKDMSHMAAFNVTTYLGKSIIAFHRLMDEPQPERLTKWAKALMTHIGDRHE